MKPRNFPAKKLMRQMIAQKLPIDQRLLLAARAKRTKIARSMK